MKLIQNKDNNRTWMCFQESEYNVCGFSNIPNCILLARIRNWIITCDSVLFIRLPCVYELPTNNSWLNWGWLLGGVEISAENRRKAVNKKSYRHAPVRVRARVACPGCVNVTWRVLVCVYKDKFNIKSWSWTEYEVRTLQNSKFASLCMLPWHRIYPVSCSKPPIHPQGPRFVEPSLLLFRLAHRSVYVCVGELRPKPSAAAMKLGGMGSVERVLIRVRNRGRNQPPIWVAATRHRPARYPKRRLCRCNLLDEG